MLMIEPGHEFVFSAESAFSCQPRAIALGLWPGREQALKARFKGAGGGMEPMVDRVLPE